jgi:branched-chain amino acid transport system ATP-binding protein
MSELLTCSELDAGYQGTSVVRRLDLVVGHGEVIALLGPNGAGKTTLLTTLAGLLPAIAGSVQLNGIELRRLSATARARRGLVLVPDDRALFTTLTAKENLLLGARKQGLGVAEVLEYFPTLTKRLNISAGQLSGGEQQMLAIGRALVQGPKVLLIDELSMGLAPAVVEILLPIVRRIATETGAGVILVEQHVRLALQIADRAVVLVHGETVLVDDASSVLHKPERLEQAYLGRTTADAEDGVTG